MKIIISGFTVLMIAGAIIALCVVSLVLGRQYIDLRQDELEETMQLNKNTAVDECFKASKVTTNNEDNVVEEPAMYIYELCMNDKGYLSTYDAD